MLNVLSSGSGHKWRFYRAGGFDQVSLDTGADLLALDQLDQKLWVALACPAQGLEFDTKTLQLIDTDKDGRIRVPEILAAVKWAGAMLKSADDLTKSAPALPLSAINDATPEGKQILASARQILKDLGKADATSITVEDTADTVKIFAQTKFNGDGVIPLESATEATIQGIIKDILACVGEVPDRSGKPGVNQAKVDQFFAELQAFSDWWKKAEGDQTILPLGDATPTAVTALKAVKGKVEDYFARCRLANYDIRALGALNRQEADYLALAAKDLTITAQEIAGFPLARIQPGTSLPLLDGINPAWAAPLAKFQSDVVKPLLGDQKTITEADWNTIQGKLTVYEVWAGSKAGLLVEKLGLPRVREILATNAKDAITQLINQDKALEPEVNAIASVDRLVRYYRDLYTLLNNFVTFRDFYGRKQKAIFQVGTLYLDGRSCDLCVRADDAGRHGALAGLSRCYLAYCECVRKSTNEKMTIAAAFTDGDSDFLMAARNGIFYDRQGRDWDATILRVVEQPISIRQAFWSPYKRVAKMVESQIEKMAAARDKAITDQAAAGVANASKKVESPAPPPAPTALQNSAKEAFDVAKFAGIFAAIGLAIGAIGGAVTAVAHGFMGLRFWQMPLAIGGALMLISGPAMLLAYMKLRQRNIGPILDANGWAVNARAKVNVPFGGSLTQIAELPAGASRSIEDPFVQEKSSKPMWIVIGLAVYIFLGINYDNGNIHEWTNGKFGELPESVRKAKEDKESGRDAETLREKRKAAEVKAVTNAVPATNAPPAP